MVVRISSSFLLPLQNNNNGSDDEDFAAKKRERFCCFWTSPSFSYPPRVEKKRPATTRKRRATPFSPKSREMIKERRRVCFL